MTTIRSEDVRALREETGIGIMDCKNALVEANGDIERAKEILREKGLQMLTQQEERPVREGRIQAYAHHTGKVGVLVEVACNTDFAANSAEFLQFASDVALHIAAENPMFVSPDEVPAEVLDAELAEFRTQLEEQGKPANIIDKAIEGRIKRFYEVNCLTKQAFIKDPNVTIEDLLAELRTKTGENIFIRRFTRYAIEVEGE